MNFRFLILDLRFGQKLFLNTLNSLLLTFCFSLLCTGFLAAQPIGPEAKREFSVKRKQVFEFAKAPRVTRNGDKVVIVFKTKDFCDVTAAIEDEEGKIVRHLACGILGPKAEKPFLKNSLTQRLVWDGKNDFGRYIDDKDKLTVRISLGLKAKYEKNMFYHPFRKLGNDTAIAIDKDGVYVYENNLVDYLKKYDHDGNYVRTLYPFPRSKIKQVKGLNWRAVPPDGERIPNKLFGFGEGEKTVTLLPFQTPLFKVGNYWMGGMTIHKGVIAMVGSKLARVGTDGSTRGMELYGHSSRINLGEKLGSRLPFSVAFSPDGKWIYMTRVFWKRSKYSHGLVNGVYRMPFNRMQPPKLFIGTNDRGKEKGRFDLAMSVAVDPKGRIYVADWENDRVQVFTPDGKFHTMFKVLGPAQIEIDPNTSEIYVFSWQARTQFVHMMTKAKNLAYNNRVKKVLQVFAPLDTAKGGAPQVRTRADHTVALGPKYRGRTVKLNLRHMYDRVKVDFWSNPKRVWVSTRGGNRDSLYMLELKQGNLELKRNFTAELKKAGYDQHVGHFQRQFLAFDPVHNHLYLGEADTGEGKIFSFVTRIDVATGKHKRIRLPAGSPDLAIDAYGHAFLRLGTAVTRYKLPDWREVPFDYGESGKLAASVTSHATNALSAIKTPGGQGGSNRYGSIGVSPKGEIIVSCAYKIKSTDTRKKDNTAGSTSKRWRPQLYPGRPGSQYIHVYDRHGQIKYEDIVKGGGMYTGGIDLDMQGNAYVNIRSARIIDGKKASFWPNGTIMKFGPGKGKFVTAGKPMVPLNEKPKRKPDVGGKWALDALWSYGWGSAGSTNHCWCRHSQFKVDYFGRSFIPESDRFTIAVVDTYGQLIMRIGKYGNADDGKPLVKAPPWEKHYSIGGDETALMDAHYVTVQTDKRLFIADIGNSRVISVKLDYHKEKRIALKDVPDAAK